MRGLNFGTVPLLFANSYMSPNEPSTISVAARYLLKLCVVGMYIHTSTHDPHTVAETYIPSSKSCNHIFCCLAHGVVKTVREIPDKGYAYAMMMERVPPLWVLTITDGRQYPSRLTRPPLPKDSYQPKGATRRQMLDLSKPPKSTAILHCSMFTKQLDIVHCHQKHNIEILQLSQTVHQII